MKPSPHQQIIDSLKTVDEEGLFSTLQQLIQNPPKFAKKENLDNWKEVLTRFDSIFEKLKDHYDTSEENNAIAIPVPKPTFPKELVLQILHFCKILFEHSYNKYNYVSVKYLPQLLELDDITIQQAVLEVTAQLVKKVVRSRRATAEIYLDQNMESKVFTLAQGWGTKDSGFDLATVANSSKQLNLPLHFEFFNQPQKDDKSLAGQNIIHIQDLQSYSESSIDILKQMVATLNVPKEFHFPLFTRIRLSKAFNSYENRKEFVKIKLLAFEILVQGHRIEGSTVSYFFRSDADITQELLDMAFGEGSIEENMRVQALKTLAAVVNDNLRLNAVVQASQSNSTNGMLPHTIRKAIAIMTSSIADPFFTPGFIEGLFYLIASIVSTTQGATALKTSGLVPSLLPLLSFTTDNQQYLKIITKAVNILEILVELDDSTGDTLRDLGAVQILISRIALEIKEVSSALKLNDKQEIEQAQEITGLPAVRLTLLKSFLRTLASCLQGRMTDILEGQLPSCLEQIFKNGVRFGGSLFSIAASILANIMHNDPTCYNALEQTHLPDTYLESLTPELFLSSKALANVPSTIGALCINATGLKKVTDKNIVSMIINLFLSQKHSKSLSACAVNLGAGFDELLRHHPSLKSQAMQSIANMLEELNKLISSKQEEELEKDTQFQEFILDAVSSVSKLLENLLLNADHGQNFIDAKCMDHLMNILMHPLIPQASHASRTLTIAVQTLAANNANNIVHLMRIFVQSLNEQFKLLDLATAWRDGSQFMVLVREDNKVARTISSVQRIVGILGSFVREVANYVAFSALGEWNSTAGMTAFENLSHLHRALLWEMASNKSNEQKAAESEQKPVEGGEQPQQPPAEENQEPQEPRVLNLSEDQNSMNIDVNPLSNSVQIPIPKNNEHQEIALMIAGIHSLFKGLVKTAAIPTRRREDKIIVTLVQSLSKELIKHLTWAPKKSENVGDQCIYLTSVLSELRSLLFDERRNFAQTLLLYTFHHAGGLTEFFNVFSWLSEKFLADKSSSMEIVSTTRTETKDEKSKNPLEMALVSWSKLLKYLTNAPIILASPVTANLLTQKLPGQTGPFDPHKFVHELQDKTLKQLIPIWESPNLKLYPQSFLVSLLSSLMQIMESEDGAKAERPVVVPKPAFTPDPNVIEMLVGMGFPRARSVEALRQTGVNSLELATDWLINNPEYDMEPEPTELELGGEGGEEDDELALALAMSLGQDKQTEKAPEQIPEQKKEVVETKEALNPVQSLTQKLIENCFELISLQESSQAVGEMLLGYCRKHEDKYPVVVETLIKKIKELANHEPSNLFGNLLQIMAVMTADSVAKAICLNNDIPALLITILTDMIVKTATDQPLPSWITNALLTLDAFAQFPLPKKDEELKSPFPLFSLTQEQQREALLICLGLLKFTLNPETLKATLLLCSRLTKNQQNATTLFQEAGIQQLLGLSSQKNSQNGIMVLLNIIIRHLIEDPSTLQTAMEAEIVRNINAAPGAKLNPKLLVTNLAAVLCRDPNIFMQAVESTCRFQAGTTTIVAAKAKTNTASTGTDNASTAPSDKVERTPEKSKVKRIPSIAKQLIGLLINTLEESIKTQVEGEEKKEGHNIPTSALLQILTDLISDYPMIGQIILRYQLNQNTESDVNFIAFVLEKLLPYPHASNQPVDDEKQSRNSLATKLLAALCSRPDGRKKVITEVVHILNIQVLHLSQNNYEYPVILHSLVDFVYLLLTSRASPNLAKEIVKLVMESEAVNILVNALKVLNLNQPQVFDVANSIIKPLELLSKLSPQAAKDTTAAVNQSTHEGGLVEEIVLNTSNLGTNFDAENEEEGEEEDEEGESEEEIEEFESGPLDQNPPADTQHQVGEQMFTDEGTEEFEEGEDEEEGMEDEVEDTGLEQIDLPSHFPFGTSGVSVVLEEPREININLGELNLNRGIRLINDLFSLPFLGGPEGAQPVENESPLVYLMNQVAEGRGIGARQVEDQMRRLLGNTFSLGMPKQSLVRWTDDGLKLPAALLAFSQRFEPLVIEIIKKATEEEAEKKPVEATQSAPQGMEATVTPMSVEPTTQPQSQAQPQTQPQATEPQVAPQVTTQTIPQQNQPQVTIPEQVEPQVIPMTVEPTNQPENQNPPLVPQPTQANPNPPMSTNLIDPTFLDALPEELRSEVLAAQSNQSTDQPANTNLNPDFLAALPPDIQAEVLEQERQEQQRRQREAAQPRADASRAEEMDNASFIATLSPELREEVLLSGDEAFIASLPPQLAAEAQALRERTFRGRGFWGRPAAVPVNLSNPTLNVPPNPSDLFDNKGKPVIEEWMIPYLMKILYLQQPLSKGLLQRLFLHLCTYQTTRTAILNNLLGLLAGYLGAEFTLGDGRKAVVVNNLKAAPTITELPVHSLFGYQAGINYNINDNSATQLPPLVYRRILEIISFLVKNNPLVVDLMTNVAPKEKGVVEVKLKQTSLSPLEVLLELVGAPPILKTTQLLENLISVLTQAVKSLQAKQPKEKEKEKPAVTEQPANTQETAQQATTQTTQQNQTTQQQNQETTTTTEATTQQTTATTEKKEVPKEELVPKIKCIQLQKHQLENLANTLAILPAISDQAYKHINAIMEFASTEPLNRDVLITRLMLGVDKMSAMVKNNIDNIRLQMEKSTTHPTVILSMLPPSSLEPTLLRILKSIVALTPPEYITSSFNMEPMWESLDATLKVLNTKKAAEGVLSALSPLLPIIEAFFLLNTAALSTLDLKQSIISETSLQNPLITRFIKFTEQYRSLLNDIVKQNPSMLEESFAVLLKLPHHIDFENKRAYFKTQLAKEKSDRDYSGEIRLNVRRNYVMEDSYYQLIARRPDEMRGRLYVHFNGEEGIDAGGVTREWYATLSKEMFNPNYCLFTPTAEQTFQPNKNSAINHDHLAYFKFVGMVIGKALMDGQLLDAHFTRSFYKHILGLPVAYQDMEAIDPDYYKNLKWILENDVTDLDLTFSVQQEEFGVVSVVDLKPSGRNIPVTNENKEEYVRLVTENKMTTAIKQQIKSFLEGFHLLIKPSLVSIFTPKELELLISGLPDIDVEDLRSNTEYKGYTAQSPVIQWFWQVVSEFEQEEKAQLVQFVTGTSKVPLGGFKELRGMSGPQKFQILKVPDVTRLPTAHTCFNQLDLPEYPSFEILKQNLLIAIREGHLGFGFG